MQPGSSSADQPEINWWPSIMWRNNLTRKGGNYLLPFMHRAGFPGELRLSSWIVLLRLWQLSIPVYHFPQCLCRFWQPTVLFPEDSSRKSSCQCIQGCFFNTLLLIWHVYRLMVKMWITHTVHPISLLLLECWSAPRVGVLNLPGPLNRPKPEHRGWPSTRESWYSSAEGTGPFAYYACYQVQGQQLIVEKYGKCW